MQILARSKIFHPFAYFRQRLKKGVKTSLILFSQILGKGKGKKGKRKRGKRQEERVQTSTKGKDVLDSVFLAMLEGIVNLLLGHVGAGQMHASFQSNMLGGIGADLQGGLLIGEKKRRKKREKRREEKRREEKRREEKRREEKRREEKRREEKRREETRREEKRREEAGKEGIKRLKDWFWICIRAGFEYSQRAFLI
jgi:hypothetical protein